MYCFLACHFHHVAGTAGPQRLLYFPGSTPVGRRYRFKLSARRMASTALPVVTNALARGVWCTCTIPPRHTSRCAITQPSCLAQVMRLPASPGRDLHAHARAPFDHVVRDTGAFAHQARFAFAPAIFHGIKRWDYSGLGRDYSTASPSHPTSSTTSIGRHRTDLPAGRLGAQPQNV
jgi:hypothetical protein